MESLAGIKLPFTYQCIKANSTVWKLQIINKERRNKKIIKFAAAFDLSLYLIVDLFLGCCRLGGHNKTLLLLQVAVRLTQTALQLTT